jgi:hypothetical protein
MGPREIPLARGEVLIGRSSSCDVVVDEMLVSRQHARLLVSRTALFVEDLGSTNGVIVNEVRTAGATPLRDGDRLIIGTQEMVVRSVAEMEDIPDTGKRPSYRTLPAPKPATTTHRAAIRIAGPHPGMEGFEAQRTEKQEGLLTMARMADRMIAMGRKEAAARLLGDHLTGALAKAKEGQTIPRQVQETVGIYGMKLADITRDGNWANLAIELFELCRRPLPEKAIALLESSVERLETFDRTTWERYQAVLSEVASELPPGERELAERILRIPNR